MGKPKCPKCETDYWVAQPSGECWLCMVTSGHGRGGPFGGETGGESVGLDCNWLPSTDLNDDDVWVPRDGHSIYDAAPRPPGCIDPWAEVKP